MLPNLDELNIAFIDPSTRSSGVFLALKGKIRAYTIAYPIEESTHLECLGRYAIHFTKLNKEIPFDLMVIEGYSYASADLAMRGELYGTIKAIFAAHKVPIIVMEIQTWKSLLQWRLPKASVSEKQEYINECARRYGIRFQTSDEVDAHLFFQALKKCSRGDFVKGMGSKIRDQLERLYIDL
jgi:hypothetical protein